MKYLKDHLRELLAALFLIAAGVLLLLDPERFTAVVIAVIGVLLLIVAILSAVRYFRAPAAEAAKGQELFIALIALCLGAVCLIKPSIWESVFPSLAVLYGILLIFIALARIQSAVNMLRLKLSLWYLPCIGAAVALALGLIVALFPDMSLMPIWVFTGISLIVNGLLALVFFFLIYSDARKAAAAEARKAAAIAAAQEALAASDRPPQA